MVLDTPFRILAYAPVEVGPRSGKKDASYLVVLARGPQSGAHSDLPNSFSWQSGGLGGGRKRRGTGRNVRPLLKGRPAYGRPPPHAWGQAEPLLDPLP